MDEEKKSVPDMPSNIPGYRSLYIGFMNEYQRGQVSGEEVGEAIMKLANHFAEYNLEVAYQERRFRKIASMVENQVDEKTNKPITSAKAKVLTDASDEALDLLVAETHLKNIEQYINSLKALQKGILNEYSHMGG
jgi:hypothetical protein